MLVVVNFLSVMDEIQKVLDSLEKSVRSLQDQMDSMKGAGEVPVSGVKSPERHYLQLEVTCTHSKKIINQQECMGKLSLGYI